MSQHVPKDWSDFPSTSTPIDAAELERMERGISNSERLWVSPIVSGKVRVGPIILVNEMWQFVEEDRVYAYPVYYGEGFGIDGLSISLRGNVVGGTAWLALYDSSNAGMPGDPVVQGTVAMDTNGWKSTTFSAVTGLAPGWYFHASRFSDRLDVHGGIPVMPVDAPSLENAVRQDGFLSRGLLATSTTTGALPSDPAMGNNAGMMPIIGARFV